MSPKRKPPALLRPPSLIEGYNDAETPKRPSIASNGLLSILRQGFNNVLISHKEASEPSTSPQIRPSPKLTDSQRSHKIIIQSPNLDRGFDDDDDDDDEDYNGSSSPTRRLSLGASLPSVTHTPKTLSKLPTGPLESSEWWEDPDLVDKNEPERTDLKELFEIDDLDDKQDSSNRASSPTSAQRPSRSSGHDKWWEEDDEWNAENEDPIKRLLGPNVSREQLSRSLEASGSSFPRSSIMPPTLPKEKRPRALGQVLGEISVTSLPEYANLKAEEMYIAVKQDDYCFSLSDSVYNKSTSSSPKRLSFDNTQRPPLAKNACGTSPLRKSLDYHLRRFTTSASTTSVSTGAADRTLSSSSRTTRTVSRKKLFPTASGSMFKVPAPRPPSNAKVAQADIEAPKKVIIS
jgi:hypothetical protein